MNKDNNSVILNEKYRPKNIDQILGNQHFKTKLKEYVDDGQIPHLLFYGPAGTGKSTTAKILAKSVTDEYLYINASNEGNIDTIRTKVERFCSTLSINSDFRVIILDEADGISAHGMRCLRPIMEEFHQNARFILTCNYVQNLIDPIISRCTGRYEFIGSPKKDCLKLLAKILKKEGIKYELKPNLVNIMQQHYPDIRKMINTCQQLTIKDEKTGEKKLQSIEKIDSCKYEIIKLIKNGKTNEIRDMIAKRNVVIEQIYNHLWIKIDEIVDKENIGTAMIILANYGAQHTQTVNTRLNFVACCIELMGLGNDK